MMLLTTERLDRTISEHRAANREAEILAEATKASAAMWANWTWKIEYLYLAVCVSYLRNVG
jgi:hypothetical protein